MTGPEEVAFLCEYCRGDLLAWFEMSPFEPGGVEVLGAIRTTLDGRPKDWLEFQRQTV